MRTYFSFFFFFTKCRKSLVALINSMQIIFTGNPQYIFTTELKLTVTEQWNIFYESFLTVTAFSQSRIALSTLGIFYALWILIAGHVKC